MPLQLTTRAPSPPHSESIPDSRSTDQRAFDKGVAAVFAHRPAVYHLPTDDDPTCTQLSRIFYASRYVHPTITYGNLHGAPVTPAEFVRAAILPPTDSSRNRLTYLLGDLGVGKTAFVNWLISTQLRSHCEAGSLWFVRIDVEDLAQSRALNVSDLLLHAADYIVGYLAARYPATFEAATNELAALRESVIYTKQLRDGPGTPVTRQPDIASALSQLVTTLRARTQRTFCLILDNLDFLCHLADRGLYSDASPDGDRNLMLKIVDFVDLFGRKHELGHLGANVVLVTRQDSHDIILAAKAPLSLATPMSHGDVYVIRSPGLPVAVQARCELLRDFAKAQLEPGKRAL